MYEIIYSRRFKTSYKRLDRSGRFDREEFGEVIELLEAGQELPKKYFDHALIGNLQAKRECHLASDILLVYEKHIEYKVITLSDIGNHAHVFGS